MNSTLLKTAREVAYYRVTRGSHSAQLGQEQTSWVSTPAGPGHLGWRTDCSKYVSRTAWPQEDTPLRWQVDVDFSMIRWP